MGTEPGFRWTSSQLDSRIDGLSVSSTKGDLESGVATDALRWTNGELEISVEGLGSQWRIGCLVKKTWCVEKLSLDAVTVKSRPEKKTNTSATRGGVRLPQITLPLALDLRDISISELTLDLADGATPMVIEDVELTASASQSTVDISEFRARWQQHTVRVAGDVTLQKNYPIKRTHQYAQ